MSMPALPRPLPSLLAASFLALLVVFSATAEAQPTKDTAARAEAKRLLRAGNAAYQRGNYSAALEKFEQAQAAFPSVRIQYNVGQTMRKLGRPVEATIAFEAFLEKSDRITTAERRQATAALAKLEPEVARVTVVTTPPGVAITLGGIDRGTTPLTKPIVVAPGTHELTLGHPGYKPVRENLTVAGGEARRVSYDLVADPPVKALPPPVAVVPEAAPVPESRTTPAPVAVEPPAMAPALSGRREAAPVNQSQRTVGVTLLVASAVLAVGGAAFMGASWARYNEAQDNGCGTDCDAAADEVDSRALWSKLLFGAAAVTGVGGGTLLLMTPRAPEGVASGRGLLLVGRGTF